MSDLYQIIRAHLAGARLWLEPSTREAAGIITAIQHVEHELTPGHTSYLGNPMTADSHLRLIVTQLEKLKRPPQATALKFGAPKQDGGPRPLPGITEAIADIERARALLIVDV